MKATYKEFGKYLRFIANLYSQYGDKELKHNDEFIILYDKLCKMHPDYDHGAQRIEELKETFLNNFEIYGEGWHEQKETNEK